MARALGGARIHPDNLQLPRERERRKNETTHDCSSFSFALPVFCSCHPSPNFQYFSGQQRAPRNQNAAAISGTVFDPDGHVVAAARVTLLHAMAQLEERETNSEGKYEFDGLLAGTYEVVGTAAGFDQLPIELVLQAGENHTLDLHLKLSALLDRVVVSAAPGGELTSQIASSVSVVTAEEIDDRARKQLWTCYGACLALRSISQEAAERLRAPSSAAAIRITT